MNKFVLCFATTLFLVTQVSSPNTPLSRICFARGEYIYSKDMKTGVTKRVGKGSYPNLSPDGRQLAFSIDNLTREPDSKIISREIVVLNLETNKLTSFDSLKSYLCYLPIWSPDGTQLAFSILSGERWQAGVMEIATGKWEILSDKLPANGGVSLCSWTADNQSILVQDLDNIFQVDLNGKLLRKISFAEVVDDVSYTSSLTRFSLSPSGRYLLFDTGNLPDEPRLPIVWIYDLETHKRTRISPKTLSAYNPQWLPSGEEIIFAATPARSKRNTPAVYRIRRDGTLLELLIPNAEQPTFAVSR